MSKPSASFTPALIAKRFAQIGKVVIVGKYHTAFTGGHLLIRIERKESKLAEGSDLFALNLRTQALTAVLDNSKIVFVGDFANSVQTPWIAKDDDWQDCFGS